MKFIHNSVIRSLSNTDLSFELKRYLVGKHLLLTDEPFLIKDISIQGNFLFFHSKSNQVTIHDIKEIQLNTTQKVLRLLTKKKNYTLRILP